MSVFGAESGARRRWHRQHAAAGGDGFQNDASCPHINRLSTFG